MSCIFEITRKLKDLGPVKGGERRGECRGWSDTSLGAWSNLIKLMLAWKMVEKYK